MTFGTLKSDIASDLERTLADDAMTGETWDDVIGRYINDAIRMLKGKHWWFLEGPTSAALTSTTTASNSYVSEYSGLIQLDSFRITISGQKQELIQVDIYEMESMHDGSTSTGQPDSYCRYGGRVRLYPTPNDTFTLTWTGLFEEAALTLDADANDWTTHGQLVVKARAKLMLLRDYIKDMEAVPAAMAAEAEAMMALDREHIRRTALRRLKPRC